jgi:hypothetical protein
MRKNKYKNNSAGYMWVNRDVCKRKMSFPSEVSVKK